MLDVTITSLMEFFKKNEYDPQFQKETGQIYFMLKIQGLEFPFFTRIFLESQLIQLLIFIPCQIKPPYIADVARLLHMINKELDLPGFGMDETANAVFYRVMLPAPMNQISKKLLKSFVLTIERVCEMFSTPISAVATGHTSLKEIINKSYEMQNKKGS
jgi:hypothetical protein